MELDRRHILGLAAGGLIAAALPGRAAADQRLEPLNRLAAAGGRRFGTCLGTRTGGFADSAYRDLVTAECGIITPENELKWGWVRRQPTGFDFAAADRLLAFAEANRLAMRGHTLLWHHPKWMPAWTQNYDFGARPVEAAEHMVREHVETVCTRYGNRIVSYDVVNEAVDNQSGGMRETSLSRAMGGAEPVVDLAFHAAREAAPRAQLVYNDYMSFEAGNGPHRTGVLRLLEGFRKRGVPVDALGIQSHIGPNGPGQGGFGGEGERDWRAFVDAVVAMGYKLLITELDVNDRHFPADIPVRDRAAADYVRPYLDFMLSYPELGDVVAWGLSDKYSWLRFGQPHADSLTLRPCPYDDALAPKALRAAIARALNGARPRKA